MTFEYPLTWTAVDSNETVTAEVELCIEFKVTDWGCPARIHYDENDHPAQAPEIEVVSVTMEVSPHVYRPATNELDEYARDWAEEHLDMLIDAATQ